MTTANGASGRHPWAAVGAVLGLAAVAAGAFGAHALRERLPAADLEIFETAARYQMYHALALVAVGLSALSRSRAGRAACISFLAGTAVFSGSLYLLVLVGPRAWGAVTPVGGVLLMVGWVLVAVAAWGVSQPKGQTGAQT